MTWYVRHTEDHADHIARYPTPEAAIEAACTLMDAGREVTGIGMGDTDDTIAPKEIARIYQIWVRANSSFGKRIQ